MLKLHNYQNEAISAIKEAGYSGICQLPTGTGKTIIFSNLLNSYPNNSLIIAHRLELLHQTKNKLAEWAPSIKTYILKEEKPIEKPNAIIGNISSAIKPKRLECLKEHNPKLIIIDEAHHLAAPSYQNLIKTFPSSKILGFTATPFRTDRQKLNLPIIYKKNIPEMIRAGFLSPLIGHQVNTKVNISSALPSSTINKNARILTDFYDSSERKEIDINDAQSAKIIETQQCNELTLKIYKEKCTDRTHTIFFCVSKSQSISLSKYLNENGIPSAPIIDGLSKEIRTQYLYEFHTGKLKCLTNFNVLSEGYDEPRIDCIFMIRPTTSESLYLQCIGRGTRLHSDKQNCLIIDYVYQTNRYEKALLTLENIEGLKEKEKREGRIAIESDEPKIITAKDVAISDGSVEYHSLINDKGSKKITPAQLSTIQKHYHQDKIKELGIENMSVQEASDFIYNMPPTKNQKWRLEHEGLWFQGMSFGIASKILKFYWADQLQKAQQIYQDAKFDYEVENGLIENESCYHCYSCGQEVDEYYNDMNYCESCYEYIKY